MSRVAASIAVTLALAGVAAGCDTTDEGADAGDEKARATPGPEEPEQPLSAAEERGRDLFVASCGSCHTLDAAGTQGSIGPDLDEAALTDEADILAAIEKGPGAMPSGLLGGGDAQAVAAFVAATGN